MTDQFHRLLMRVQKPARYVGGEYNQIIKDKKDVDVRVAFCFPDTYEIGMSNIGMRILYGVMNEMSGVWCERVFAPWGDMEDKMRAHGLPLWALESHDAVRDFDLVAFTLGYEMCYSNVLNMLELAQIPLLSKDRGGLENIVFAGGVCAVNPEPLADFIDFFSVGEGEESTPEIIECYRAAKKQGLTKLEFLHEVAKIEGVYVPSFYTHTYHEDGTLAAITPEPGAPERVKKRIVQDMNTAYFPTKTIVPSTQIVHDRSNLEIFRGCIRGCRFCQAGMLYRPTREKDVEVLKDYAYKMLKNTGHEEISLSSLSSSDYSHLKELVTFLIDEFKSKGINISLPSLRIDAFSLDVMGQVQDIRKSSLTFAPEAGSQRMRDVINKGLTEEIILDGAGQAFEGGWNKVKLYFMLGLPTETEDDMRAIPELADKIARRYYEIPKDQRNGKCQITTSTSFFIPKPFTPFQWARMYTNEEYISRAAIVKHAFNDQLNRKSLKYNWHDAEVTVLEGVFARGDRKTSAVIEEAYRLGCLYDSWSDQFDNNKWMQAFENTGLDIAFYNHRERSLDEVFPWDFIDIGVTKDFLKREWNHAMNAEVTPNCRMKCSGCGVAKWKGGVCIESKN